VASYHRYNNPKPLDLIPNYNFHYLKQRFLDDTGQIHLTIDNPQALTDYVNQKVTGIETMIQLPGFTPVEKEAARLWVATIKKELAALQ